MSESTNSLHEVASSLTELPARAGTAYLVLMDDGQVLSGHFNLEAATNKAETVGGVLIAAPILADYRHRIGRLSP